MSKPFILNFWSSQFLRLLRHCRNEREWFWRKKGHSTHQLSCNSEEVATWISLIGWPLKTYNVQLLITATREKKTLKKTSTFKGSYRNTSKATKILQEVYFFLPIEFDAINFQSSVLQKGEKNIRWQFHYKLWYFVSKIVVTYFVTKLFYLEIFLELDAEGQEFTN